jgi:DNA-binding IclR family transcriptional regulator
MGEFAAALPDPLVAAAGPALAWVRDECGESAQLYRRDGAERVCVAAAERAHGLRTTVPLGTRLPLTAGSGAQVICAWSDPAAVADVLTSAEFTARTLAEVRRRGWAQSVAQREAGVASVSAPVLAADGDLLAAISLSGPIERLGRSPGARFAPVLVAGARRIAAAMTDR